MVKRLILYSLKGLDILTNVDTPKPTPTVRRSTKAKTGEDRANDIAMALRGNPKEVRIINSGLENNGQILAGYLNLKDTMALRGYLSQKTVMQILLPWLEGREKKFGCDIAVKNPTWPKEKIFSYIYEPGAVSSEDFEKGLPLNEHKWPRKGVTRGLISWIVTLYKLITHAGEKMFTSTSSLDPQSKNKYLGGFHPEDYHRAYNLLKFHWRESSEARKSKGSMPRKQNLQSKAPEFLADADYRLVRDEESHQLTAVNPALVDFLQREDDSGDASNDDAGLEVGHSNELQEAEALEKFELGFEDIFKNTSSKLPPIKMAMLEPEVQRAVLVNIGRKAKVLWPLSADRLSPPASMTLELATEHIRRGALEATFNTETNFTEDDVKRFWNLQITLNNASSIPPLYSICANLLHLDPQRPSVESRTRLPHQVTEVA